MPFSRKVKDEMLVKCARHCCICHRFRGIKIELHHIIQEADGGDNTAENCIPLCFDCHADMRSYDDSHPRGTKYSSNELKNHRDSWFRKIENPNLNSYSNNTKEVDIEVFNRVRELLPWNGSIDYIRTKDFGGSFPLTSLADLDNFEQNSYDPNFEFIDPELESLRSEIKTAISECRRSIANNTFWLDGNPGWASIPKEWQYEQPKLYQSTVNNIHELCNTVVENYDTLIRTGRRKLGVN